MALEFLRRNRTEGNVVTAPGARMESDGHDEVGQALAPHPSGTFTGYCFYHEQDVYAVIATGDLLLAFGDLQDTVEGKLAVGKAVREAFARDVVPRIRG